MSGIPCLDEQGDQLARSVSWKNEVSRDLAVSRDGLPQTGVLSVRIGGEQIQVSAKLFFYVFRESKRIDICAKS